MYSVLEFRKLLKPVNSYNQWTFNSKDVEKNSWNLVVIIKSNNQCNETIHDLKLLRYFNTIYILHNV